MSEVCHKCSCALEEMRLNAARILHGFDALVIGRQMERILGERGGLIFDG